jgi:hypothetical protein
MNRAVWIPGQATRRNDHNRLTDAHLLERFVQRQDETAFETLIRPFSPASSRLGAHPSPESEWHISMPYPHNSRRLLTCSARIAVHLKRLSPYGNSVGNDSLMAERG